MLRVERQAKIVQLLQTRGSLQVEELAKELGVSPMTIRRDLGTLEEHNKVERYHGGAVAKQEESYARKKTSHQGEKERIARRCFAFIKEGDTVFLDAGTTTYEIARLLQSMPDIMVVTNDLEIGQLLKESRVRLFLCGGEVQKSTGSVFDQYARQMLENFKFDIGFFGAASINKNFEVTTPTIEKMWLKRQVPRQCSESFLAVDASKFEKQSMTKINHLGDYTGVITGKRFSEEEKKRLDAMGAVIYGLTEESR